MIVIVNEIGIEIDVVDDHHEKNYVDHDDDVYVIDIDQDYHRDDDDDIDQVNVIENDNLEMI